MIAFISGDILQSNAFALVNTVNTVGVMGKGVALQFKNEFPYNYKVYRNHCHTHQLKIGELLAVKDNSLLMGERLIINFPTKTRWRLPSEYVYIEKGLIALSKLITDRNIATIAVPALGCANGGLDWITVKAMIFQHLSLPNIVINVYEPLW